MEVKNYFMNMSKLSIKKSLGYLIIIILQIVQIVVLCNDLGFFVGVGLYIVMAILVFFLIWVLNKLFK
jgi:hypothetical protein